MKKSWVFPVLLLFIILISTLETEARVITTKQGLEEGNVNEISSNYLAGTEVNGALELTEHNEVEDCETGDEECLKRRVALDAHLDYIYTRHIPNKRH